MVPQTALGSSQLEKYLFVVGQDNKVEQRLVSLGLAHRDLVVILSGITEQDRIISDNLQKIGPGMPVQPLAQAGSREWSPVTKGHGSACRICQGVAQRRV